jgi:putative DNA primase/helicase
MLPSPSMAFQGEPHNPSAVPLVANVSPIDDARKTSIDVTECDLPLLTEQSIDALERANEPPKLFLQKGLPVRVDLDEDGQPVIRPLKVPHMRHALGEACDFYKRQKKARVSVSPLRDLVENVLVSPSLPFHGIRGIISAPFFNARGDMVTQRGYDPGSRLYLALENGLAIPSVPVKPTTKQRKEAVALLDDLFYEFPFKDAASKAHTFAIALLPFAREMISGPTPLHLVGAPAAGTGKTLLAQAATFPSCGKVAASPFGKTDEEQRKLITTLVVGGCPAILLDNLEGLVSSAPLCAALTSDLWKDRLLGTNSEVKLPNRAVWIATSNNARLSRDTTRRTISIRLDAESEKPAEREIKRTDPLLDYARDNRGKLIAACLTIVQSWIVAGKKSGTAKMGSFESWSRVIGGILANAEIPGFLTNAKELADTADDESDSMRAFVEQWCQDHREPVNATALLPLALKAGLVDSEAKSPASALGRLLAKNIDAVFGGHKIVKAPRICGIQNWSLVGLSGACGTCGTSTAPTHHEKNTEKTPYGNGKEKAPQAPQAPQDDDEVFPEIPF